MKISKKIDRKGFTLIELLVVVLIIGILAAIALPQYELAVGKTRTAEAITALRAITTAQESRFLAQGAYTADLNSLDITVVNPGKFYTYECERLRTCSASSSSANMPYIEFHLQKMSTGADAAYLGKHWCVAENSNAITTRICSNWGPKDTAMINSSYTYYLIQ